LKEDTRRWNDLPSSWIGKINIMKMSILPKSIFRFNAMPINIPMLFFSEIEKSILKHMEKQNTANILSKKSNASGITIPDLKLYYRARVTNATWYWYKRHKD
jgi:hypothetical protein